MNHPTHRALGATATGLTLTGGAGADTLLGSDADDALYGQAGNDLLAGGAGADWMEGGSGNDVYEVDDLNDTVVELAHSGLDRVQASISWHLDRYVEELRLVGDADLTGWGNAGNNRLTGNTGDNLLRGGAGNDALNGLSGTDTLVGGRGDDHYWVDDASDQVIERPTRAGGQDTVTASCTWTLGSGVEALELTGSADLAGYGNSLSNVIVGNAGNNLLWGGSDHGNDTLVGNAGDDMLGSNDGQDWLEGDEGNDWLQAGANDDTLTGGEGNDTLMGGTGNDRYMGDAGDDVLNDGYASASGGGNDTYSFNLGWGHDTLSDVGGQDTVVFGSKEGLSFERTASGGLLISNSLSGDTLLVSNCFIGSPAGVYAVERFEFGDAESLSLADINTLLRTGTDAAQTIYGELTGADWLSAAGGNDTVLAQGGNDTVDGGSGDDVLNGGQGQDGLDGGSGNDSLLGDNGADTLLGGTGDDVLYGGNGNDWLNGGAGNDTLAGNLGSDTVVLDTLDGSDTLYLFTSGGEDQLRIAQTGLPVGNGDAVLDGAVAQAPGAALQADAELVIVQASARTALTADQLSAALGPADHAFTLGDTRLYALSNGQDTALYYFQAADADAHVAASELTLLATLRSTGTLAVGDVVLGG